MHATSLMAYAPILAVDVWDDRLLSHHLQVNAPMGVD